MVIIGGGDRRTRVSGARVLYKNGSGGFWGAICVRREARPICHALALSLRTPGNAPTASMPTARRSNFPF